MLSHAKPPPETRLPPPRSPVRGVSSRSPATTPMTASCRPVPARPNGLNPKATAPAAGGLFFPQAKSLGIDQSETSPALQQKIVYAGIVGRSFAQASDTLEHLADLS